MHSRIYQISTEPISAEDFLTESNLDGHWFTKEIADCVDDEVNLTEEIDGFKTLLERHQMAAFHDEASFTFNPKGRMAYFKSAHKSFITAAQTAASLTLEQFSANEGSQLLDALSRSYCDRDGWYVFSEQYDVIPFDEFLHYAVIGQRYYIGGVLDYHA